MKEIRLGSHKLKIFDSIEELPIVRHHKFSKMMLIDAHIGADLSDFDAHVERIIRYIKSNKNDLAVKELANLRQNIFFIQSEISPKHLAFAALVYSIDGKAVTDLSDEALREIVKCLSDVPVKEIEKVIDESKKKLDFELQTYFPSLFDSAAIKEYYDQLKRRTILLLEKLTRGELTDEENEELERITSSLVLFSEPQPFTGAESVEIQQDKQFENACLAIAQNTNTDPKDFTVLEYYNALLYLKEQMKEQRKRARKK